MIENLKHLVLVRHGESEGDVRREAWRQGLPYQTDKTPENEVLTELGFTQSAKSGEWINKNLLLGGFAISAFELSFVSSVIRTEQSAIAMNLFNCLWQEDPRLNERNRGQITGIDKNQHQQLFPNSYKQMLDDPIGWVPPGGESILDVSYKLTSFYEDIKTASSVIIAGHRDSMWASMIPIEGLTKKELAKVDTNKIDNGQIWHYTSVNPNTKQQAPKLMWKRSYNPNQPDNNGDWMKLKE